jgi:hypothetical protein
MFSASHLRMLRFESLTGQGREMRVKVSKPGRLD